MDNIIIKEALSAEELGLNTGTGVSFGVGEGISSNDASPAQPFGTPPIIEVPLAPPAELMAGSNTFTVDGEGGTKLLPKPAIKVEDAPRSQTPIPEFLYVQNGFGGGMVALGVDTEDILAAIAIDKLPDGIFAFVKGSRRLYYLSNRTLTGIGTKTGSCRWLRVPAGEDSLSFLTESEVITLMESTDSYNRTKWVSISADIDKLRVEYDQATTYLDGKYEQNRSLFEQTASSMSAELASHKSYVDGKIIDQNSQLLILSNEISTRVSSSEFNPLLGRMTQAESSITQNAADIRLKASQSVVDGLTTRLSSAEVNIDGAKADILLKAEKSVVDGLLTWKSSAQVDIDGAKGNINMLVTKTDGTNTKLASITIDAADGIKLVAEKVVFSSGKDLPTYISENAPAYNDTALKEQLANNLGYESYNAYYTDAITNGRTIIKNGYLQTNLIDTDAIMAKELVASNMIVKGGKIGDFTVNNKLVGDGYTNGALNGNQIMLDPSNNEIVLAKNGAKRVRLINNELTTLALLQVDGGTKYCTTGTSVSSAVTDNALLASKTSLGVGGAGLSKTTYAGINGVTPQLSSLVANITKVPLSSGFYSMDVPYAFNIVHNGLKGDNNTYHRITGTNSATVTVKLMNAAGVVKSTTDSLTLKVDTEKTGASPVFYGTARFNFAVSAADSYWVEATITVVGGSERPIRYQSWNSGNAFSSGYWSEQYDMNLQYELSLRPGMTIDGSIGLTEISNSGIQSVWTPSRYIRIDGNTANNVFVESKGVWMHNGYTIDFNPDTLKTTIGFDPANFATKNYVDTNFYNRTESDGRYLGINATAADSAKLGGVAASSYYNSTNANLDTVSWSANLLTANSMNISGRIRNSLKGDPAYVGNLAGSNWWGIGEYDASTVQLGMVDTNMHFMAGAVNLWVSGNLTANGGNQVWDNSNLPKVRVMQRMDQVLDLSIANLSLGCSATYGCHTNGIGSNWGTLVSYGNGGVSDTNQIYLNSSNELYTRFWNNGTGNSGWAKYWSDRNLNRSDVDFVARTLTAVGSASLKHNVKHYLRSEAAGAWNGGFYYDTYGNESLLVGFQNPNTRIKFKTGVDFETLAANSVTGMVNASLDIGSADVKFGVTAQSNTYSGSGFTATGWGITQTGDANFQNTWVRGKLTTYEFVQNKISIANGNMIVSDNAKCSAVADMRSSSIIRFTFPEQHPFNEGDTLRCKSNGKDYSFLVGWIGYDRTVVDCYANLDALWASNPAAGDLLVRWNSTDAARKGLLYLCSSDAGSPNYQVLYDNTVKAQFGNLDGRSWQGATLPANTWGLWVDNGYFNGAINATSGKIAGWTIGSTNISSPNGTINIYSDRNTIYVGKPSGGHVMFGQTFINGNYTGKYGFSATDASNRELFRIDDEVCRFAGGAISFTATDVTFADSVKLQWQSGGRNYVKNSKVNETSNSYGFGSRSVDLIGGEIYTLSANGRCNNVSSGKWLVVYLYKPDWSWATTVDITSTSDMTNKITFTAPSTGTYIITSYYYDGSSPREGTVTINWYKVEKGYNATDWTPALEDVDCKLTKIDSTGAYFGTIEAEKIIGSTISGKTIIGKNGTKDAIRLDGVSGVLTTYKTDGVSNAMQLSGGELTFYNDSNVPSLFLKNNNIALSQFTSASSWSVGAIGQVNIDASVGSGEFTISTVGTYSATTSINLYVDATYDIIIHREQEYITSVTVISRMYLDKYDSTNGWVQQSLVGSVNDSDYKTGGNAGVSSTKAMNINYTISATGTYRYRLVTAAYSTISGPSCSRLSFTGYSTMNSSMTTGLLQNGCFVGINGITAYNGGANGGTGAFVSVDINSSIILNVKGGTNMPGVLLSGSMSSSGTIDSNKTWGAKVVAGSVSTSNLSTGKYRITHNLGHTRYAFIGTPAAMYNGNAAAGVNSVVESSNYCDIEIRYGTTLCNIPFNFVLVGYNY